MIDGLKHKILMILEDFETSFRIEDKIKLLHCLVNISLSSRKNIECWIKHKCTRSATEVMKFLFSGLVLYLISGDVTLDGLKKKTIFYLKSRAFSISATISIGQIIQQCWYFLPFHQIL